MRNRSISALFLLVLISSVSWTATAQPQQPPTTAELATRRQLIQQALQEADAHHWERVLELGEQAARIQDSASLLLVIAEAQVQLGRFGDALGNAERCMQFVHDPQHFIQDREFVVTHCDRFVQTLPARVGRVTMMIPPNPPAELHITVAGHAIRPALFNLPQVVNPGQVQVRAELGGRVLVDRTLTVAEGATATVPVTLPAPSETGPTPAPTQEPVVRPVSVAPLVVLGVSVAALGTSLGLFVARNGAITRFESGCDEPDRLRCQDTTHNRDAFHTANTLDTATGVVFGLGVAATVGGAVWLIVDRVTAVRRSGVSLRPHLSIGRNTANVGFEGTL